MDFPFISLEDVTQRVFDEFDIATSWRVYIVEDYVFIECKILYISNFYNLRMVQSLIANIYSNDS